MSGKPRVYTLCGSTRWPQAHDLANLHLSTQGHIVIPLGMHGHADQPQGAQSDRPTARVREEAQ